MATNTNLGDQIITFDYKQLAKGEGFNAINFKLHGKGVYEGLTVSILDNSTVRLSTGILLIENVSKSLSLHCRTRTNVDVTVNSANVYVIARFLWINAEDNYVDFLAVDSASINSDDLILGRCVFPDGVNLTEIDTSRRNKAYGVFYNEEYLEFNTIAEEPITNVVEVKDGNAVINGKLVNFSEDTIAVPDTINGRVDLITIDDSGVLGIIQGVDSVTPIAPIYPSTQLVVSEISRGASRTNVFGSDITNVVRLKNKIINADEYYVNITGDTMTGPLNIDQSTVTPLTLKNTTSDADNLFEIESTGTLNKVGFIIKKDSVPYWEVYADSSTNTNNFVIKNIGTGNTVASFDTATDLASFISISTSSDLDVLGNLTLATGVSVNSILDTSTGTSSTTLLTENAVRLLVNAITFSTEKIGSLYLSGNAINIDDSFLFNISIGAQTVLADITTLTSSSWYAISLEENTSNFDVRLLSAIPEAGYTPSLANNQLDMYFLYNSSFNYCRFEDTGTFYRPIYIFKTNATSSEFDNYLRPIPVLNKPKSHVILTDDSSQILADNSLVSVTLTNIWLDFNSEISGASTNRVFTAKESGRYGTYTNYNLFTDQSSNYHVEFYSTIQSQDNIIGALASSSVAAGSSISFNFSELLHLAKNDTLESKVQKVGTAGATTRLNYYSETSATQYRIIEE